MISEDYNDGLKIENMDELYQLEYTGSGYNDESPIYTTVRVSKKDFSIYELCRKYNNEKLILDVNFQRKNVWQSKQKYELIESILMGLPLPIFYFKQQDNSTYVVVDGKQRLSAIFAFMNNEYALKGLKILSFLNGKKYKDLVGEFAIYQSQLEDYQVYSHLILPPTPDKILFDIFDRVNRGGTRLNKQEIRNALYHGKGLDMISEIALSDEFIKATRIDPKRDTRMKASYLLTRFYAFYLLRCELLYSKGEKYIYNDDVDDLLEVTLTYMNSLSDDGLKQLKEMVLNALRETYLVLGQGAFRKRLISDNPINMNIFETTLYFIVLILEKDRELSNDEIQSKLKELITGSEFLNCIGDSRDHHAKVNGRFNMMEMLAVEVCSDV